MKAIACTLFAFFLAAVALPLGAAALSADEITSSTAVLMDAQTGQVLFDKNMSQKMFPASTTKIMTAVLVAENCQMSDTLAVSESAIDIDEWNSSNIALSPGEELPVDSVMYGLMLPSANDAANALAEQVAGSQDAFAAMMTAKAQEIGAVNTRFQNAHGLHNDNHYTTAYDMALITRYASANRTFMKYFSTATHTIPGTNLQPIARPFTNYQYMLVKETQYYDPAVIGGKVGYTTEAKHTMSTVAEKYGRTLICVVMSSPNRNDKFNDTEKLLEYGFTQFRKVTLDEDAFDSAAIPITREGVPSGTVSFRSESEFSALLRNDVNIRSIRVESGFPLAFGETDTLPTEVQVVIDSPDPTLPALLGRQPMVSNILMDGAAPQLVNGKIQSSSEPLYKSVSFYVMLLLVGVLCLLISLLLWRQYTLQKRRRQRMARLSRRIRSNLSNSI